MFRLFQSKPFLDPELGELRRKAGRWRGTIRLDAKPPVPLVLSGKGSGPDAEALRAARSLPADFASWRNAIERGLFEHYLPYREAVTAGQLDLPASLGALATPSAVWPHAEVDFVQVTPLDGELTVEIGYRVAWDEEHTLGARFRRGRMVELCGSVLRP